MDTSGLGTSDLLYPGHCCRSRVSSKKTGEAGINPGWDTGDWDYSVTSFKVPLINVTI